MRERFDGGPVRRVRRQAVTDAYERWEVTYPAGGTTVSGVLLRPGGRGPFPAVVRCHGYVEPSAYVTGQGLAREQDALARAGFVVLHTDYRGHAASDPAGELERETRLGHARDVLHAVASVKRLPSVDPDRVGLLGRSMGGGLVLNALVVQPDAVRSAVVHASVSSFFTENLDRFTIPGRPEAARRLAARLGSRTQDPAAYRELSPRTFLDRVAVPVQVHDGTADDTCPVRWSRRTHRLLRAAGGRRGPAAPPRGAARLRPAVAPVDGAHDPLPAPHDGGLRRGSGTAQARAGLACLDQGTAAL